jgi:hypothetical protein
VRIIARSIAKDGHQGQCQRIRHGTAPQLCKLIPRGLVSSQPRKKLEGGTQTTSGLMGLGPGAKQHFQCRVHIAKALFEQLRRPENVFLGQSLVDHATNRLLGSGMIAGTLLQVGHFQPTPVLLVTLDRLRQEPASRETARGFERILQVLFIEQGGFAKQAPLFECVRRRNEIAEQFGIDISRAPVSAQLHFAVGHLAIAAAELIVAMDETLEAKEPWSDATSDALIKQARELLVATEVGEGFSRHYFEALQRNPDVVLAHAEAAKLFNPRKTAK